MTALPGGLVSKDSFMRFWIEGGRKGEGQEEEDGSDNNNEIRGIEEKLFGLRSACL